MRVFTVITPLSIVTLHKVVTEKLPDLLSLTVVHTGGEELLVAGLRTLCLDHLHLPLLLVGVTVGFTHVVQDAASQDHGGHHVQSTVVPLAQTLPACPQPQQGLLGHTERSAESLIKELLWFCQRCVTCPPAFFFRIRLH